MNVCVFHVTDQDVWDLRIRPLGQDEVWVSCRDEQAAKDLADAMCRNTIGVERLPDKAGTAAELE